MQEVREQLIEKFFSNQCTAEEAEYVQAFFDAHPEELAHYVSNADLLTSEAHKQLDAAISQKMLMGIEKEIAKQQAKIIRFNWLKYAVAASVIGIVFFIAMQYNSNNIAPKTVVSTTQQPVKTENTGAALKTAINTTNKTMFIALQDGSTVTIYPKSSLQYLQPFPTNERHLTLKGIALFKVAKDKTKPFVVTTDHISTTALGTSFRIEAEEKSNRITVQLFSGKVMISKAANNSNDFTTQYLVPGQQIQVNKATYAANISSFKLQEVGNKVKKESAATLPNGSLTFNQSSLAEVFTRLQSAFKTTIYFNTSDVTNMTFTGKFEQDDDIASILNTIALLNGLSVLKTNTGFAIKK